LYRRFCIAVCCRAALRRFSRRCGVFHGVAAFLFFLAVIGSAPRESTRATRFYSGGRRFGGVWCERAEFLSVFASVFLRLREMNPDEKN